MRVDVLHGGGCACVCLVVCIFTSQLTDAKSIFQLRKYFDLCQQISAVKRYFFASADNSFKSIDSAIQLNMRLFVWTNILNIVCFWNHVREQYSLHIFCLHILLWYETQNIVEMPSNRKSDTRNECHRLKKKTRMEKGDRKKNEITNWLLLVTVLRIERTSDVRAR